MLVSTGAAGIQQSSSNLDTLLHPQQSTRRPQMVVRLHGRKMNPDSAREVIEHVRGKIIATTMGSFLQGRIDILAPVEGRALACLQSLGAQGGCYAFRWTLDVQAMIWHNVTLERLLNSTKSIQDNVFIAPLWEEGDLHFFITSRLLTKFPLFAGDTHWTQPLPSLPELFRENWPGIADVFCATRVLVA